MAGGVSTAGLKLIATAHLLAFQSLAASGGQIISLHLLFRLQIFFAAEGQLGQRAVLIFEICAYDLNKRIFEGFVQESKENILPFPTHRF